MQVGAFDTPFERSIPYLYRNIILSVYYHKQNKVNLIELNQKIFIIFVDIFAEQFIKLKLFFTGQRRDLSNDVSQSQAPPCYLNDGR